MLMTQASSATSNTAPSLWLLASPRGTRIGFAVLPDGYGGVVSVTVLPKPWASRAQSAVSVRHAAGSSTHVVLHELQALGISSEASVIGNLANSVALVAREQPDLLGLTWPRTHTDVPDAQPPALEHVLHIAMLADRSTLSEGQDSLEGSYAPSLSRVLTRVQFVAEVETLVHRTRPSYSEHRETLSAPRGRVLDSSLVEALASGKPQLESVFDELSIDTPLLRVIVSALRVVLEGDLPRAISDLAPGLTRRSAYLLRHFASVTQIPREQALDLGRRVRLAPQDRPWSRCLELAIVVLRNWGVTPVGQDAEVTSIVITAATERLWEQCLEQALAQAFGNSLTPNRANGEAHMHVPNPWQFRGERMTANFMESARRPDFAFWVGDILVVADAKYKLDSLGEPSAADGYQMFAYSHLACAGSTPTATAALLYPVRDDSEFAQRERRRAPELTYALWMVGVPFPSPLDVATSANWAGYIARIASALRDASASWKIADPEPVEKLVS